LSVFGESFSVNGMALFHWLDQRAAGALLHPTSLPGPSGIGTLGREAHTFVDTLAAAGLRYWQMCPLGPTGYGDSPYQSFSAFAGNPYLINLESLIRYGLLYPEETVVLDSGDTASVDYGLQYHHRRSILNLAYERFTQDRAIEEDYGSFDHFQEIHRDWLNPYGLFQVLKQAYDGQPWTTWEPEHRDWSRARRLSTQSPWKEQLTAEAFLQYLFYAQWGQLKEYANDKGVEIIGDIPIFVSLDSADVWQHPNLFHLDRHHQPTEVAGVPPDYFSEDGQKWGNPLYRWKKMERDRFAWWIRRLRFNFEQFDVIRLDHFRGFAAAYHIPADAPDAREGKWIKGPGLGFFKEIHRQLGEVRLIAEDLGLIDEAVKDLLEDTGLPGMAVLQFGFEDHDSQFLPHNLHPESVLYSGTHDNNTTLGWYRSAPESTRDLVRRYLQVSGDDIPWDLIRCGYASVARLFVVPFQDFLNLGSGARLNTPGTSLGNWQWRLGQDQLDHFRQVSAPYLYQLGHLYGRHFRTTPQSSDQ